MGKEERDDRGVDRTYNYILKKKIGMRRAKTIRLNCRVLDMDGWKREILSNFFSFLLINMCFIARRVVCSPGISKLALATTSFHPYLAVKLHWNQCLVKQLNFKTTILKRRRAKEEKGVLSRKGRSTEWEKGHSREYTWYLKTWIQKRLIR